MLIFLLLFLNTSSVETLASLGAVPGVTKRQLNEPSQLFLLQIYDNQWQSNPWLKFPHVLRLGQRVFVDVLLQPNAQTTSEDGLRPLLKECFFTRHSSPRSQPKHVLIATGCPVDTSAMVHYSKLRSALRSSRFSFEPKQFYFPGSFMFLHCQVSVCAWNDTLINRPGENAVQCPDGLHCNQMNFVDPPTEGDHQTPAAEGLENSSKGQEQQIYVSSGPLRPVMAEEDQDKATAEQKRRFSSTKLCVTQTKCQPCDTANAVASDAASSLQNDRITFVKGLSTGSVVAISSASFIVGTLLVGGMWYIYEVTRAERVVKKNRRRQEDCNCSTTDSSTPATACLTATDTL